MMLQFPINYLDYRSWSTNKVCTTSIEVNQADTFSSKVLHVIVIRQIISIWTGSNVSVLNPDQNDRHTWHELTSSVIHLFESYIHLAYLLKGILWDRRWIAPSIGISSHTCWFFYGNAFLIIKLSKLPSFKVIRALIASQSTFK